MERRFQVFVCLQLKIYQEDGGEKSHVNGLMDVLMFGEASILECCAHAVETK